MDTPAISVVMSVYNGEVYLAEAVESILAQTFRDFEFIIIDDGSKDRTGLMLAEYARRDERVRVVAQENRGRAESLNRGIEMARAELIARMDADDVALPERLAQQWEFLQAHPEVGLLGTAVENIGPGGEKLGTYVPVTEDGDLRQIMLQWCPFRHPTILMRKEIALKAGGYRKALRDADDYDLWLRMAERARMANLPEPLLCYRFHPDQASMSNMVHQMLCCRTAIVMAFMRRQGLPDPLTNINEITPEFAQQIGVSDEDIQHDVAAAHYIWIGMLARLRPAEALRLVSNLVRMRGKAGVEKRVVADALFVAARIRFKQRRIAAALSAAARGLVMHPAAASRVARMAFSRRMRDLNRRVLRLVAWRQKNEFGSNENWHAGS